MLFGEIPIFFTAALIFIIGMVATHDVKPVIVEDGYHCIEYNAKGECTKQELFDYEIKSYGCITKPWGEDE